jgi:hypothetical protein
MTTEAYSRNARPAARGALLPFVALGVAAIAGAALICFLLWPTWPSAPVPLDAPAIPVTVADVLFEVPPAAIRAAVQRHPGPHERIDLAFLWPSLTPPPQDSKTETQPTANAEGDMAPPPASSGRVFVNIAGLTGLLPPTARLRGIYPRYVEEQAAAGPDGLAILRFRPATPYDGEDLIYLAAKPEQFFARCTRAAGAVPGTCIYERALDGAEITLRFPRTWLDEDWHGVAAGFDRLVAQLHPPRN